MSLPASTADELCAAAASWNTTGATHPSAPPAVARYAAQYVRYLDRDLSSYSFFRRDLMRAVHPC